MRIPTLAVLLALLLPALAAAGLTPEERRAEWARRNARYPNAPYYTPPGPVDVYDNQGGRGDPVARIPTGIKFLVVEGQADWYPRIYVPCMDVEGWFDRMQLCAYKGNDVVLDGQAIQRLENELFEKSLAAGTPVPADPPGSPGPPAAAPPPAPDPSVPVAGTSPDAPYEPPAWTRADPESAQFKQGLREERTRRETKYKGAPESRFPWLDLKIYKEQDMKEEVAAIPAGVRCQVISDPSGWNVRIYCPCMDVEGWFDRMILCAFKGSNLTIDMNEVYKLEEKLFMASLGKEPSPDPVGPVVIPGGDASPASSSRPGCACGSAAKPAPVTPAPPGASSPATAAPPASAPPPGVPVTPAEAPIMQATNVSGLRVFARAGKTPDSASPVQIPPGAAVDVLRHEGDWCYIRYAGKEGWVRAFYLGLGK